MGTMNQNTAAAADAAITAAAAGVSTAADTARAEQQLFRDGAAFLASLNAEKKTRVLLTVLAVLAAENHKAVKDEYKDRFKDLRKSYSGKTDTAPYLDGVAELESAIVETTIRDTVNGLEETWNELAENIPDATAAILKCLDNPRQTIADGVKRIDFACRHLGLTADSRKAVSARVDAMSARFAADKATRNATAD
jgi:hypothetical protein